MAQLCDEAVAVRGLDLQPRPAGLDSAVDWVQGSILDDDARQRACRGVSHLFHLAGYPHLWARNAATFERVNRQGTVAMLESAKAARVTRFITTASETVFLGPDAKGTTIDETTPLPPVDALAGPYARSKARADRAVGAAGEEGLEVVRVYPTLITGPNDLNVTPPQRMIADFITGKAPAYLECHLNVVGVTDVAAGLVRAARHAPSGSQYILGGENLWLSEILRKLEAITGKRLARTAIPGWVALAAGRVKETIANLTGKPPQASVEGVRLALRSTAFSNAKAQNELGLSVTPADTVLSEAVRWLHDAGLS